MRRLPSAEEGAGPTLSEGLSVRLLSDTCKKLVSGEMLRARVGWRWMGRHHSTALTLPQEVLRSFREFLPVRSVIDVKSRPLPDFYFPQKIVSGLYLSGWVRYEEHTHLLGGRAKKRREGE